MVDVVLIHGPSGSGKGTQCPVLAQQLGGVCVSMGSLLREHAKTFNDIAGGALADSSDILRLLDGALSNIPRNQSIVLDGTARMPEEAKWLRDKLAELGRNVDVVIDLYIPEEESFRRLLNRGDGRPDDTKSGIQKRLDWYRSTVSRTLAFWRTQTKVVRVDGLGTREEVTERLKELVNAA